MAHVIPIALADWHSPCPSDVQQRAVDGLEDGRVLFFPTLGFPLEAAETALLSPATAGTSKNISWDGATGQLRGGSVEGELAVALRAMMQRFAAASHALVLALLPDYSRALVPSRTSFRAVEAAGRATSWRKDDTRLHVDSFPSMPVQGKRILRLFSNVNPEGRSRSWTLGGPFEMVARRFLPTLTAPLPGSDRLLQWCSITKSRRSAYDHYMLQLHDRMKADGGYQADPEHTTYDFPPNSTWLVFTDQVPHAATQGQYLLEQTFYVPVEAMREPSRAPLRVLERLMRRALV